MKHKSEKIFDRHKSRLLLNAYFTIAAAMLLLPIFTVLFNLTFNNWQTSFLASIFVFLIFTPILFMVVTLCQLLLYPYYKKLPTNLLLLSGTALVILLIYLFVSPYLDLAL